MSAKTAFTQRRYDLDWLRVLAILTIFIYHSGRFFDMGGWHVKNPSMYVGVEIWEAFLASWIMPLIFLISGASVFYALRKGGAAKFIKGKVLRLLVPLLVGMFTHSILQVYLERLTRGQFHGSFFEFLPHYFDGFYAFGGNFAWMGIHLWYLEMLFVFCLLLLPLFTWLKNGSGRRLLDGLGNLLARPGAIMLPALPVILMLNIVDPGSILGNRGFGGWSMLVYPFFFLPGFVIASHEGIQQSIRRLRWLSLAMGAALTITLIFLLAGPDEDPAFGTLGYVLVNSLFGLSSWCWILTIMGFGLTHLTRNTPFLKYANQAVLPFYILHQPVLLCVGYFVVGWAIPDALKFVAISASSFPIIIGSYEFLVRRSNLPRILFGMKVLPKAPAAQAREAFLVR